MHLCYTCMYQCALIACVKWGWPQLGTTDSKHCVWPEMLGDVALSLMVFSLIRGIDIVVSDQYTVWVVSGACDTPICTSKFAVVLSKTSVDNFGLDFSLILFWSYWSVASSCKIPGGWFGQFIPNYISKDQLSSWTRCNLLLPCINK